MSNCSDELPAKCSSMDNNITRLRGNISNLASYGTTVLSVVIFDSSF